MQYLNQFVAGTSGTARLDTRRMTRLLMGTAITLSGLLVLAGQMSDSLLAWLQALPASEAAALQGGMVAALATALGAAPALFMKRGLAERQRNALLGFSAGVMLAASFFSLLLPAIDVGAGILADRAAATALAAVALALGVGAMLFIERQVPHTHEDEAESAARRSVWLMVLAIAIHNFPEGMAIGTALSSAQGTAGQSVTLAIALQDMPEGLVVALSLVAIGLSRWLAFAIGAASGLAEPLAAVVSSQIVGSNPLFYPIGLALAAGAMLFVVSHEMIPGTHRRGGESLSTIALTCGFAVMLVLDGSL